ncbi:MAG: NADH-quinone oxidoreductase subunit NuoF [Actinobacteria bacterium]|nr:MAG: NADH-quinone oxidoreductase subunit NuoF [Actinomycetota bacterium]
MSKTKVIVGFGTCGLAAGAQAVYDKFKENEKNGYELDITSCMGMCYQEPMVEVRQGDKSYVYGSVNEKVVSKIIDEHLGQGQVVEKNLVLSPDQDTEHKAFIEHQTRFVLRNCGKINPERIDDYIAVGGYESAKKCVTSMKPEEIRQEILDSKLRGRGGAGFPTGAKWNFVADADQKYFICNADEGDPGAFMDRSVLEGDPHAVLEGMIIGSFAIGATEGYIYCRAEYPLAIKRLNIAIARAKEKGFLGKSIFGTGFSLEIKIKEGAGAFVCGEETALMASIEGKRGMPMMRPPFPAVSGLWGKPTIINNVETLASVPKIIEMGAKKYADMGFEKSGGTKVFAVTGKVKRSGLVEVPMGISIKKLLFDIAGGVLDDKEFKAVQLGGPTGGCLPMDMLDTPVDYESLMATGAVVGSGGMVVADQSTCMVDMARYFLSFAQNESCGKCTPCRLGTKRMLEILERITEGKGKEEDIDTLLAMGDKVKKSSLCALGGTAPNPVLTTVRYFKDEYLAHINEKRCPAGVCKELITITIDSKLCTGCEICAKECPQDAIKGERKQPHEIDQDKCIKCRICLGSCPFGAISSE